MRSDSKKVRLEPKGQTFCPNGLSKQYDSEYPEELEDKVHPELFFSIMLEINESLSLYWPCPFCWYSSHFLAVFTCGLALIFPFCCLSQAEERLREVIEDANYELRKRGVRMYFKRKFCRTWIELEIFEDVEGEDIEMGRLLKNEQERLRRNREGDGQSIYREIEMENFGRDFHENGDIH